MVSELREHVIAYIESHHKLAEASAVDLLLEDHQPILLCQAALDLLGAEAPLLTRELVEEVAGHRAALRPRVEPRRSESASSGSTAEAWSEVGYALIAEGFVSPPAHQDPLAAYQRLFADRYRRLRRLLVVRPGLSGARSMKDARTAERELQVIGLVREVHTTPRQRHVILTVEDESGALEVLIPRDSPLAAQPILSDEVLGLSLKRSKDASKLPVVDEIERPDVPFGRSATAASRPGKAIFLSDLHLGSKTFLDEPWGRLVDFLHGRGPEAEAAEGIAFAVVAGDLVDGIGIYPRQERDLAIVDVLEQYAELGRRLRELPSTLEIVVLPGNHDAVSPAEPQPALAPGLARYLPQNVHSVANPSTFALNGVVVEAYHGRGFDDLIPALPGTSYARPTEVMKRMLAMRHLAPIYGGRTPLAPLPRDGLVIDPAPDILVTGHAHTYSADQYHGVLLLNVSTWQGETEYQRMRNISPVPGRAAIVDLAQPSRLSTLVTLDAMGPKVTLRAGGPQ
ncbi:MAG: metallophosphoesterase [Thermoplasmata archaeon]